MGTAFLTDTPDFIQGERTTRVPYTRGLPSRITWTCPYDGDQRSVTVLDVELADVDRLLGTVAGDVVCAFGHRVSIVAGLTTRLDVVG